MILRNQLKSWTSFKQIMFAKKTKLNFFYKKKAEIISYGQLKIRRKTFTATLNGRLIQALSTLLLSKSHTLIAAIEYPDAHAL